MVPCRSQARINGEGCGRKGIRRKNCCQTKMMRRDSSSDHARAIPASDAQHDRRGSVKSGLRLLYQERTGDPT
ncbi:hypothetical protein AMELA_G00244100 [Ameiurus melas]|uniref:Uncharacterized protein n=1 Tax=Ameiurus melas TaxID=219545 RepID=A0A7J5ZS79_AMEME|nr:hypothetical protein AMELA_G00244100 [Ameiurus melas]